MTAWQRASWYGISWQNLFNLAFLVSYDKLLSVSIHILIQRLFDNNRRLFKSFNGIISFCKQLKQNKCCLCVQINSSISCGNSPVRVLKILA